MPGFFEDGKWAYAQFTAILGLLNSAAQWLTSPDKEKGFLMLGVALEKTEIGVKNFKLFAPVEAEKKQESPDA
jgi:hypothetical protein